MDSIYASPEDFHQMKQRDKIRGLHLLEYFVNQCHQLGVIELGLLRKFTDFDLL
jgi:N-acetylglutamate synthase-like GNAT family acetyltransferase